MRGYAKKTRSIQMKMITVALMLLVSQFASATVRTAADMAQLLESKEVKTYLSSNHYNILKSVEYIGTSRCSGFPSMYVLHMSIYTNDGYIQCKKDAVVGECDSEVRTKISLSKEIDCK
jgi:hypothetical protein